MCMQLLLSFGGIGMHLFLGAKTVLIMVCKFAQSILKLKCQILNNYEWMVMTIN